jgi:hypothetical protein
MSLENGKMMNKAGYSEVPPHKQHHTDGEPLEAHEARINTRGSMFRNMLNRFKRMF